MAGVRRSVRVGERVRAELGAALIRHVSDPRLTQVVITRVEVTDDLQLAWVFVRVADEDTPEGRKQVMRGLKAAGGVLRRELGRHLDLRRVPELRWRFDEGMDAQARVEELLREIHDEDEAKKA